MAGSKEIRIKIKSVQNTRKITKAMEMVSAAKMKRAQDRMRATRPYVARALTIAMHVSRANHEYKHPFLVKRDTVKRVGVVLVTTDKGLCGGMNTNVLRMLTSQMKEWQAKGVGVEFCALGNKGLSFLQRVGGKVVSHLVGMGDRPHMERIIGPVKVLLDRYRAGEIDEVHLFFTRFVNTMKQEPRHGTLIPIPEMFQDEKGEMVSVGSMKSNWDYIYEPDAKEVLTALITRYLESVVFQAIAENIGSEHSSRMVAMKAASDNANTVIDELTLIYNKTRQAAITTELSEIVAGAAAV